MVLCFLFLLVCLFEVTICMCVFVFSNLNRRRYAQNDETLYVAPEDERTDYVRHLSPLLCSTSCLILLQLFAVTTTNVQLVQRSPKVSLPLPTKTKPKPKLIINLFK